MQNTRVLVVEDDPAICTLLEALMRRRGYECDVVSDGNDAIRRLRCHSYSAVLLDLMLPGAFGFDVVRFLHAERPAMTSRVVIITAACAATLRDFDTSSVRTVLRKPFDIQELLDHVAACAALDKPLIARALSAAPI
ncbi:MAG: response regulator transcription factor [Thermoanaerobaculia bacterium]